MFDFISKGNSRYTIQQDVQQVQLSYLNMIALSIVFIGPVFIGLCFLQLHMCNSTISTLWTFQPPPPPPVTNCWELAEVSCLRWGLPPPSPLLDAQLSHYPDKTNHVCRGKGAVLCMDKGEGTESVHACVHIGPVGVGETCWACWVILHLNQYIKSKVFEHAHTRTHAQTHTHAL